MNSARIVAKRFQLRQAKRNKKAAGTGSDILTRRLIDLFNLFISFDAYTTWMEAHNQDPDEFYKAGALMMKKFSPWMTEGMVDNIGPLAERADGATLKPAMRQAERGGDPLEVAKNKAKGPKKPLSG